MPAHVPPRVELLNKLLKGQILVLIAIQCRPTHPAHKLPKRRLAPQIRPHHKAVDKEPDQPLDFNIRPRWPPASPP